jgi:hypothetical protein
MVKAKEKFHECVESVRELVKSYEFRLDVRKDSNSFVRKRKLCFIELLYFILNLNKRSIQLELDDFFEGVKGEKDMIISKQAFSKARQNINPDAFIKLHEITIEKAYKDNSFKKFKGYRLLAIDGSILSLYNTENIREHFGYIQNKYTQTAMAQASVLYDVENDFIIHACLDRYETSERKMAVKHLMKLSEYEKQKDLILFDRGYPSSELISELTDLKIDYAMRVSKIFKKEVREYPYNDGIIEIKHIDNKTKIRLRIIRVDIESKDKNGNITVETETIVSSILDKSFTREEFKEMYGKRWGIEKNYDTLKNKLELENYTGTSPVSIQQDFYATIFLANMAALVKAAATEQILEKNKVKDLKYEYRANTNLVIGKLKDKLIKMMLEPTLEKREIIFERIVSRLARCAVPVRNDRTAQRNKTEVKFKYSTNKKRCL